MLMFQDSHRQINNNGFPKKSEKKTKVFLKVQRNIEKYMNHIKNGGGKPLADFAWDASCN